MNRVRAEFVAPIEVRVVQAGPESWVWRVGDGAASCGGQSGEREAAWVCALSAMRGALALRRLRRAIRKGAEP